MPDRAGGVYLDTSALGRVLLEEPDSKAILSEIARYSRLLASRLLAVELRRLGLREGVTEDAEALLRTISLVPISGQVLTAAEILPPASVATLDAIHVATAIQLRDDGDLDAVMTYDRTLSAGAAEHGLAVLSPG